MSRKYGSRKRPYEEDEYGSEFDNLNMKRDESLKRLQTSFTSIIAKYTNLNLQAEINGIVAETEIIGNEKPDDSFDEYIGGDLRAAMFSDGERINKVLTQRPRDGSTSETGRRTPEGSEDVDDECQIIFSSEVYEDKHSNYSLDVMCHNPTSTEEGGRRQLGFEPQDETSPRIGSVNGLLKQPAIEMGNPDESDDDMRNDIVLLIDDTSDDEECPEGMSSSASSSSDYHSANLDSSSPSDLCELIYYDSTCAGLFPS